MPKIDFLKPQIIFEDDQILVINKPAGLLSIPDRFDMDKPNLYRMLTEMYGEIFVVHRLDFETSGVMIFAKNAEAHRLLSLQFEYHSSERIYHAVVAGTVMNTEELDIDIPLMPHPGKKGLMTPSARGKESLTKLKVLERFRVASLVECNLVTGRQHQLRVHVASIGHSLLVDGLYGTNNQFMLSSIKKRYNVKKGELERPVIARITMHARTLGIVHPTTNELVDYTADYPKDFEALISVLRKYSAFRQSYPVGYENKVIDQD